MMKYIRRTPYQAAAAVLVLMITFFMAFIFSMIIFGSDKIIQYFETRPQVTAFFKQSAVDTQIRDVEEQMMKRPYVEKVRIISKQEALELYREKNQKDPLLLELVTADILPASIEVSAKEIRSLPKIAEDLHVFSDAIDEVVYHKDVVEALVKVTRSLRTIGIILVGSLAVTSFLVTVVITGMKISSKKHEIEIMQLLGATSWYIKRPFIFEGALYGVIGATVGWVFSYTVFLYATPWLLEFLKDTQVFPVPWTFFAIQAAVGMVFGALLGAFATLLSLKRLVK